MFKDVHYSRTWAYLQAVAVIAVSYLFRVFRSPDFSSAVIIVIIGLVAVFMTIRAEEEWGRIERIVWFGLVTALSVLAIFSIRAEEERQNDRHLAVMSQFKTSLETTVNNFVRVMGHIEKTEKLSAQNLANLSGAGSYPCVVPQPEIATNRIPLVFWNKGKTNNLTGVQLRILTTREFVNQSLFMKPAIDVGTVPPVWGKQLPEFISPIPDAPDGVAVYTTDIWTQNGYYTEALNFRRDKYKPERGWAHRYWLYRLRLLPENRNVNELIKGCQSDWTDELWHKQETKQ